jgi:hypothetical protein
MRRRLCIHVLVVACFLHACDDESPVRDGGAVDQGGADSTGGADGTPAVPDAAVADTADVIGAPQDAKPDLALPDAPDASGLVPTRQLDVLFVIDNSSSMREEQMALRSGFPAFIEALKAAPGGLPDVRIGIINTNFGAGQTTPSPECFPLGDRGRLHVKPGCGLDPATAHFLATDGKGNSNFTGQLETAFSCLADLGTAGCGYEHQLQALRAAVAFPPVNVENRGFLRADARLGIVILSDEDDCSGEPDAEFFQDLIPGQAGSLRCALLGHVCGGQPVPAMAGFQWPLAGCSPHVRLATEQRSRLINVREFVDFISSLKSGRPDNIFVSLIAGWNESPGAQYQVVSRTSAIGGSELDLGPACSSVSSGVAYPAIRLRAFARAFPNHTIHNICAGDLTPAMTEIGQKLAGLMN